jgi:hypothetical protein
MSRQYVRSGNGKVHVKVDGRSHERCNLDDARLTPVGSLAEVELGALCDLCFPATDTEAVLEATEAEATDEEPAP